MMHMIKEKKTYMLSCLSIIGIFTGICALKKIYPFGIYTLDITADFEQQSIPIYYHLWDFLHGKGPLTFDWNVAGGLNFWGVCSHFSLISPFNIFFLFIKRTWIEKSMFYYLLLKFVGMGMSMCYFLEHTYSKQPNTYVKIVGSIAYALSGWTFLYYGFSWLDSAAFFPLIICFLTKLLNKDEHERSFDKTTLYYILFLTLAFIANIPQAYMICFYLIIYMGAYIFLGNRKMCKKRKCQLLLRCAVSSLCSLGISAIVFFPAAISILSSSRVSGSILHVGNYISWLLKEPYDAQNKKLILFSAIIPLLYIIIRAFRKRLSLLEGVMILAVILPVFVEGTNILWHMGPYVCFPMRWGYMLPFTLIGVAVQQYTYQEFIEQEPSNIVYYGLLIMLIQTIFIGYHKIYPVHVVMVPNSEELATAVTSENELDRIKLVDQSINSNYPLIAGLPAISNFVAIIPDAFMQAEIDWGYVQPWVRLSDVGGTLFTDSLLGYHTLVSAKDSGDQGWKINYDKSDIYSYLGETDHFEYYKINDCLPTGLVVTNSQFEQHEQTLSQAKNPLERQNELAMMFCNSKLMDITEYEISQSDEIFVNIPSDSFLYLYSGGEASLKEANITVNTNKLSFPSYENPNGDIYPSTYQNGITNLGFYPRGKVKISINQSAETSKVIIGMLDLTKYKEIVQQLDINMKEQRNFSYSIIHTTLRASITANNNEELLFLPINALSNWNIYVNGKTSDPHLLDGTWLLIPLENGNNEIIIRYAPSGLLFGITISLVSIGILILAYIYQGAKKSSAAWNALKDSSQKAFYYVCILGWYCFMLAVFIIPFLITILRIFILSN